MKHPKDSQREVGGGLACRPRNQVMTYVSSRESAKLNALPVAIYVRSVVMHRLEQGASRSM